MSRRSRATLGVVTAVLLAVSCTSLLPERFAINAPMGNTIFGWGIDAPAPDVFRRRVRAPAGFTVAIFADEIPNARLLRFTSKGDLLVSTPRPGKVLVVEPDRDGDGQSDRVRELLTHLERPHGLDLRDGWLYVAEASAIGRIRFEEDGGQVVGDYERIVTGLPEGGNHWTRTIRFGPDGKLYATVGSSCNACFEKDPRRAAMLRFEPDGTGGRIWASGLRNSVDFDWRPETGDLYATDQGRDLLGDDEPPCELNRIVEGGFYGWPIANGDRVADPDHGEGRAREIARSIPPAHGFGAHTAPLGIRFLRDPRWPEEYRGAAVVALHGSWNRTEKTGYEVVTLHWKADGTIVERKLLTGLEEDEDVIGRPVGVAEGPDGAVYVSDDYAGVIYRIARGDSETKPTRRRDPSGPAGSGALDPRAVERGRDLFAAKDCALCHDPETKREGMVARPLAGLSQRYTVATLAAFLDAPTPPMPRASLDATGRSDLAAYLLATYP